MGRSRTRRLLLWGLLLLPVAALPLSYAAGRAWINRNLERDLAFGKVKIHLDGPRLGWRLNFTTDSLRVESPGFQATAGTVRLRLRFWHSIASLRPSLASSVDTLRVDLPAQPPRKGPRSYRLRSSKPVEFPSRRIPVPIRVESRLVRVTRGGRPLAEASQVNLLSQGPKGAAVEWSSLRLDTLAFLEGPFRASARWFGKSVRYQARFRGAGGDEIRLDGERRKDDLAQGRDSLDLSIAALEKYAALLRLRAGGNASQVTGLRLSAAFRNGGPPPKSGGLFGSRKASAGIPPGLAASLRLDARVPGPMRLGPLDGTLRLDFQDSTGRIAAEARGSGESGGSMARLAGPFLLPPGDSLSPSTLLAALEADLSGYSRGVRLPIGRRMLPGDFEVSRLRVADGEALAEVRSRDGSEVRARIFRDGRKPSWKVTFSGDASPTETWARIWTDTNVNWRSAAVTGSFVPGELEVEVRGYGVTAYGAAADSLWARNLIRRRGYYLADSRLYWKGVVWPVLGEVEWGEREPVRGPRGMRLRREVQLAFRAAHREHGRLEFAMPRRRYMTITADSLAVEHLPVPRLEKALAYHPHLDGRFAWDREVRQGEAGLQAAFLYGGKRLKVDLEADWDAAWLRLTVLELALEDSRLRLGAVARLHGRQFHQLRGTRLEDVKSLSLEATRFEASHLATLFPGVVPLESGTLNGRLAYDDSGGFQGHYEAEDLRIPALRNAMEIPLIAVAGLGPDLAVAARTSSQKYPWLNDTLTLKLTDLLGERPAISLKAASAGGLRFGFQGALPGFKSIEGAFTAQGDVTLPGGAGDLRDFRLAGSMAAPLNQAFLSGLRVDSTHLEGRYAVQGLDTQAFSGEVTLRQGRLVIPSLRAVDGRGRRLSGQVEARLGKPLLLTAKVKGEALSLRLEGFQKISFRGIEATARADSTGLLATARAAGVSFQSRRGTVDLGGDLENLHLSLERSRASPGEREPVPKLGVKARLRGFRLQHEIGFREAQRFFRTVKVDKRRKRKKPVELDINLEAVGAENRVDTDILRMFFTGDLSIKGVYPYTLLSGEVAALSGEIGQTGQSYDIMDFGLKWQNATMEEGRIRIEGGKKLRVNCKPETQRTCNVFINLEGRLDEMAFTYDSDCGQTAGGEVIEPAALINSVSRGCYSGDYVSGAGGGGYGEAVFTFLEPAISDNLTKRVSRLSAGWIKTTQVSGIGAVVAKDTAANSEPVSVSLETREWKGVKGMAKAGYHPEKKVNNPWENKVAVEWRLPLERVAADSGWKRRVRDRVTLEASAETRPEEKLEEDEDREVRQQVGLRYRYKFWNLW